MTNAAELERPSWQRPPFEPGNLAHRRSGLWTVPTLRADDRAGLEEITAGIWEVMPDYQASFSVVVEQLALRIWRQRRAYADLAEHGLVREGSPPPCSPTSTSSRRRSNATSTRSASHRPRGPGSSSTSSARRTRSRS